MDRLELDYHVIREDHTAFGLKKFVVQSKIDGGHYDVIECQPNSQGLEARLHRLTNGKEGFRKYFGCWSQGTTHFIQCESLQNSSSLEDASRDGFTSTDVEQLIYDICSALKCLYDEGYACCAVNEKTVFLVHGSKQVRFKLMDLSRCVSIDPHQHNYVMLRQLPYLSSADYIPPELVRAVNKNASYHPFLAEADMYALGLLALKCIGKLPDLHSPEGKDLSKGIVRHVLVETLDSNVQAIVRKLLEFDPTQRPLPAVVLDVIHAQRKFRSQTPVPCRPVSTVPRCASTKPSTPNIHQQIPIPLPQKPKTPRPPSQHSAAPVPVVPSQGKYERSDIIDFIKNRRKKFNEMCKLY
eukprot:PhF_6_TR13939/c0_g1_i1/m.22416